MTISSSIPAAVVSMAVLRLLGGGHILENNIVQTGASAGDVDRRGRDLHDPGARDPRLLDDFRLLVGLGDRRSRRHARRAVLGAAAPLADRRAEPRVPRRQGRRRGAARPARTRRSGVKHPRELGVARRRSIKLARRQRLRADSGHGRRCGAMSARASPTSAPTCRRRCSASATSSGSTSASSCWSAA